MMNTLDDESSKEKQNFFGRLFKGLQRQLRYQMIGRKYFNPQKAKEYPGLRLTVKIILFKFKSVKNKKKFVKKKGLAWVYHECYQQWKRCFSKCRRSL